MKQAFLLSALLFTGAPVLWAQTYEDAARFGMLIPQSTARATSLAGATGAVGADFSSISQNPAGIGLYRKNEFSITLAGQGNSNEATYLGKTGTDTKGSFTLPNLGIVSVNGNQYQRSGWRSYGFGVGINRLADFNRSYSYTGRNTESSFSEQFALDANYNMDSNGLPEAESLGDLGYQNYLIDYDTSFGGYATYANYQAGALQQTKSVTTRGGISELAFAVGGNYNEQFMIGATLGLPLLNYKRDLTFTETDADHTIPDFEQAVYGRTTTTQGVGINLKLGAVFKPSDLFRFGVAIHSPTWYTLEDKDNNRLSVNSELYKGINSSSLQERDFTYTMRTPWRGIISATGFLGNVGFISADYEYVDYSSSAITLETEENKTAFGSGYFAAQQRLANDSLKANLQGSSNFRIGAEAHLENIFFRAGLGFYGSPYKRDWLQGTTKVYTAGLGYRNSRLFADMALMLTDMPSGEYAYQLPYGGTVGTIAPEARFTDKKTTVLFTIGTKF